MRSSACTGPDWSTCHLTPCNARQDKRIGYICSSHPGWSDGHVLSCPCCACMIRSAVSAVRSRASWEEAQGTMTEPAMTLHVAVDLASLCSLGAPAAAACTQAVGRVLLLSKALNPQQSCCYSFGDSRLSTRAGSARWQEVCHRREGLL